eukprot:CAMPEP_0179885022 /NCGR_PEP_ID=MMETSP0982-20121206/30031_1 /TAXON_ID=483367 /ORGANISM="non described non described, Strain CCMP 2436" /LENGTH=140 /DNA_ID=CAMNT_0021780519 /DNA_START=18 /DNA_END=437 /DNA_ORIENTATION=-
MSQVTDVAGDDAVLDAPQRWSSSAAPHMKVASTMCSRSTCARSSGHGTTPSVRARARATCTEPAALEQHVHIRGLLGNRLTQRLVAVHPGHRSWTQVINTGDSEPRPRYTHTLLPLSNRLLLFGGDLDLNCTTFDTNLPL